MNIALPSLECHARIAEQRPLRVAILLARDFTLSAFSLFVDTLRLASDELDRSGRKYVDWDVVSDTSQLVGSSAGVFVAPTARLQERKNFDYIVLVGGRLGLQPQFSDEIVAYLRCNAAKGIPLVALCTGSFVLAEAGLLRGRTACVSWLHREEFLERFPDIEVVSHRLFFEDKLVTTCAGGTAVADLAAWIVKKHVGLPAAKNAMEILQIERHRKGTDVQARMPLDVARVEDARVKMCLLLMEESVHQRCDFTKLSREAGLSRRQLERLFKRHIGVGPKKAFLRMRLEKAKQVIQYTDQTIMRIAINFGYESQDHFSKSFRAHFGVLPREMRKGLAA